MEVIRKGFPKIILDNDEVFLSHLEGIISSVDELCSLQIEKTSSSYKIRIAPSVPVYTELLLKEIINFHNLFNIKLDISKSIKTSGVIFFEIPIE